MQGIISSFRRGRKTQSKNQAILLVEGITDKKQAATLIGKSVFWKTPAKELKELNGKITGIHGGKGAVRVIFETGVPGQMIGKKVRIE